MLFKSCFSHCPVFSVGYPTAACLAFRLGKLFSMAWQVIRYSAFGCTLAWMACMAMGCAAMHRAVFRAISVVTRFLGSWLQCGGGNLVADMALEAYCG